MSEENKSAKAEQEVLSQDIVNEIKPRLEKPRKIVFVISAVQFDDGMIDGAYMPGKSLGVGQFARSSPLKCNISGTSYVTGFEYDDIYYNDQIPESQKADYQKEVRTARQWLEKSYGNLDSKRVEFWRTKRVVVDDLEKVYSTDRDEDLILYYNILGGGYPDIARNHDEAVRKNKLLYLSIEADEAERRVSHRTSLRKAKASLDEIEAKWTIEDLIYLHYYLNPKSDQGFTKNTPRNYIVLSIDDFIEGVDTKTEKKKRPLEFADAISLYKTDKDRLRIQGLFNAALYYGFINYQSKDKTYANRTTGFPYGSLPKDCVDKLLNPQNIEELSWLKKKVEQEKWIR